MKLLKIVLSLLAIGICLSGCKKDNTTSAGGQLPDTSSSGKNFLACKVNGKVQVYSGFTSYMAPDGVSYAHTIDYVQLFASGIANYNSIIRIVVDEDSANQVRSGITYFFKDETDKHFALYQLHTPSLMPSDYLTDRKSGWIRFSRLDSVASGTFEFMTYHISASNSSVKDSVRVTEGRFDISRK